MDIQLYCTVNTTVSDTVSILNDRWGKIQCSTYQFIISFFVRIIRGQRPSSSKQMLRSTREIRARSSRDSGPEKKNDTNQSDLRPSIKANISWIVLEARQAVNI